MRKLLLILICLFVSFEVKSFETTISCNWNKRITYDENEKIKEEIIHITNTFTSILDTNILVNPEDIVL